MHFRGKYMSFTADLPGRQRPRYSCPCQSTTSTGSSTTCSQEPLFLPAGSTDRCQRGAMDNSATATRSNPDPSQARALSGCRPSTRCSSVLRPYAMSATRRRCTASRRRARRPSRRCSQRAASWQAASGTPHRVRAPVRGSRRTSPRPDPGPRKSGARECSSGGCAATVPAGTATSRG